MGRGGWSRGTGIETDVGLGEGSKDVRDRRVTLVDVGGQWIGWLHWLEVGMEVVTRRKRPKKGPQETEVWVKCVHSLSLRTEVDPL